MLVVLKMTASEAGKVLTTIGKVIFNAKCNAKTRTTKLRKVVERLLKEKGLDAQTKLVQPVAGPCKL
jgi:hypothetical protein